jgi:hypothetical protein
MSKSATTLGYRTENRTQVPAQFSFVAVKKTLFRGNKKICGKVRFTIMHGWKRANYVGKWSRHGAK